MTLTVWVKLFSYGQIIFDNKADDASNDDGYHWQVNDDGYMAFFSHDNSSNVCYSDSTDICIVYFDSKKVPKNVWVHLALVKSRRQVKVYIDGDFVQAQNTEEEGIVYDTGTKRFFGWGADEDYRNGYYDHTMNNCLPNFAIDEFRYYDTNLSDAEIKAI